MVSKNAASENPVPSTHRGILVNTVHIPKTNPWLTYMARYSTIDEVLASYPDRFRADKAEDVDAVVFMNLTGDNARDVLLTVKDQTLSIEDGSADDATLTLIADTENWLAIENGELKPMMAMMQGKLKLKGKPAFAMKFMALFGYAG